MRYKEVDDNIKTPGGAAKCNDEEPNSDNTNFLLVLIILKILSLLMFKIKKKIIILYKI